VLGLKYLFDERVRFPVGLGQLGGGAPQTLWAIAFLHTSADVGHVALDHGGDARPWRNSLLAAMKSCRRRSVDLRRGFDVGRLRFVMYAVGEFGWPFGSDFTLRAWAVVTRGGVIDLDVTYFARETTGT